MRAQGLPSCYSMLGETNLGKLNQLVTRPSGKCPQWGRFQNFGFRRQSKRSCLSASSIGTAPRGVRTLSVFPIQTDRPFNEAVRVLHEMRCV